MDVTFGKSVKFRLSRSEVFLRKVKKWREKSRHFLEIAYFYPLTHLKKAGFKLGDNAHFQVEADGQVGVLVGGVDGTADEEIDVGGFLEEQAADERCAVLLE